MTLAWQCLFWATMDTPFHIFHLLWAQSAGAGAVQTVTCDLIFFFPAGSTQVSFIHTALGSALPWKTKKLACLSEWTCYSNAKDVYSMVWPWGLLEDCATERVSKQQGTINTEKCRKLYQVRSSQLSSVHRQLSLPVTKINFHFGFCCKLKMLSKNALLK